MTRAQIAALLAGAASLTLILDLVRRRQLREKYAALWLVVGAGMAVLAVFPRLLDAVADRLGVADPPNLLFFVAILVLLLVIVQLSYELSRVEEHVRVLAEEVALLRGATGDGTGEGDGEADAVTPPPSPPPPPPDH
jgi:hypothetical protein